MFLLKFDHSDFDKYVEDQLHSVLNIADVLRYLLKEPLTVSSLSKKINPPKDLERGRSKYDIYGLTEKLEKWGYIMKEVDKEKYGNTRARWILTEEGHEILFIIPKYLALGEIAYHNAYLKYKNSALVS